MFEQLPELSPDFQMSLLFFLWIFQLKSGGIAHVLADLCMCGS